MVIIKPKPLKEFMEKHPDARVSLQDWIDTVQQASWSNFNDLKADFPNASLVGNDRVVFNIRKGYYRLIVLVVFRVRTVYVRFIGSHADYDRLDASNV
jgi:mRNA interferase HigB